MTKEELMAQQLRLYSVWLKFLDHTGRYAKRYYLARNLELAPELQDPDSQQVLASYYKTRGGAS